VDGDRHFNNSSSSSSKSKRENFDKTESEKPKMMTKAVKSIESDVKA